jgi:hypothetical protein
MSNQRTPQNRLNELLDEMQEHGDKITVSQALRLIGQLRVGVVVGILVLLCTASVSIFYFGYNRGQASANINNPASTNEQPQRNVEPLVESQASQDSHASIADLDEAAAGSHEI